MERTKPFGSFILLVIISWCLSTSAYAGEDSPFYQYWIAGMGVIKTPKGVGMGIPLTLRSVNDKYNIMGALHFADIDFFAVDDENSRYYWDHFRNGQSRCRDSYTGRFAKSYLCNGEVDMTYSVAFDVDYRIPIREAWSYFLGIGLRFLNPSTFYGVIGVDLHSPFSSYPYRYRTNRSDSAIITTGSFFLGKEFLYFVIELGFKSR